MRLPLCVGLLSLTLAAVGRAQIVAVRPAPGPILNSARQALPPATGNFQDPSVIDAPTEVSEANAAPPVAPPPSRVPLSQNNPLAAGSLSPKTFNVGNDAWGEPGTCRPAELGRDHESQDDRPTADRHHSARLVRALHACRWWIPQRRRSAQVLLWQQAGPAVGISGSARAICRLDELGTTRRRPPATLRILRIRRVRDLAKHSRRQHAAARQQRCDNRL